MEKSSSASTLRKKNEARDIRKGSQNQKKNIEKSFKNYPQIDRKSIHFGSILGPKSVLDGIWSPRCKQDRSEDRFFSSWGRLGAVLGCLSGPFWEAGWPFSKDFSNFFEVLLACLFFTGFWSHFGRILEPVWKDFESIF